MPAVSLSEWDAFLGQAPGGERAHLLQSAAWGQLKAAFGWRPHPVVCGQAGALVLFRRLPVGLSFGYLPRGPVGSHPWGELWREIDAACKANRAMFLKIEPDAWTGAPLDLPTGLVSSPHEIQPPRTLIVNLDGTEDEILARMKQKTRYNIRLAQKKGVVVRPSQDLDTFHRLMLTTGSRDRFGVHTLEYYRSAYELFYPRSECELLQAEFEGQPLAGLMVFARGPRAWYFYGASSDMERSRMPTYTLQWEAMRWARLRGCREYDLWGVPDEDEDALEAQFEQRSDGLWGVYRFKRGFGGELRRQAGTWDRVYMPLLYKLYRRYVAR